MVWSLVAGLKAEEGVEMKAFVIDVSKCVGCYNCQIVCKDEHVGNEWMPYAKAQPVTGHFWMRFTQKERGTIPKVKVAYIPVPCQHCDNPPCIPACSPGAIYKREDGLVIIDPEKCNGSMDCLPACLYNCIFFNNDLKIAQKCTGCAHLLDKYGWEEPRCADACPTEAIKFGEEAELSDLIKQAEILNSEYGTKPRVYYIGLPKRFIAGTVYDPVRKEVVIGANCTLTDKENGGSFTTTTDSFGDFWFEGLKEGSFSLRIEATGFPTKLIDPISTMKDVNLGDIPLS